MCGRVNAGVWDSKSPQTVHTTHKECATVDIQTGTEQTLSTSIAGCVVEFVSH